MMSTVQSVNLSSFVPVKRRNLGQPPFVHFLPDLFLSKAHHRPQLSPFTTGLDNTQVQCDLCWTGTKTFHPNRIQFNDNLICQTSLEHPVTSDNNNWLSKKRRAREGDSQDMIPHLNNNNRPASFGRNGSFTGQSSRQNSPQRRELVILWPGTVRNQSDGLIIIYLPLTTFQ